jgi:isopenicillin N synthase-like dioxygenase
MIARWTNDRYRSTVHRVVNTSGRERYSVPLFHSGNFAHRVGCMPTRLAPDETPKYVATTVDAHMREMYRKTYRGWLPRPPPALPWRKFCLPEMQAGHWEV